MIKVRLVKKSNLHRLEVPIKIPFTPVLKSNSLEIPKIKNSVAMDS